MLVPHTGNAVDGVWPGLEQVWACDPRLQNRKNTAINRIINRYAWFIELSKYTNAALRYDKEKPKLQYDGL